MVHWLTNLDDDLKYLYYFVKVRNNSNVIREIHISQGVISYPSDIVTKFYTYYESLLNNDQANLNIKHDIPIGSTLLQSNIIDMETTFIDLEIINALKDINKKKAHSLDNFNSEFFIHS